MREMSEVPTIEPAASSQEERMPIAEERAVMEKRNIVQALAMQMMLGGGPEDRDERALELQVRWGQRYAGAFSDLFENDKVFEQDVLDGDIDAVVKALRAHGSEDEAN